MSRNHTAIYNAFPAWLSAVHHRLDDDAIEVSVQLSQQYGFLYICSLNSDNAPVTNFRLASASRTPSACG